jgi:hypothetical protein
VYEKWRQVVESGRWLLRVPAAKAGQEDITQQTRELDIKFTHTYSARFLLLTKANVVDMPRKRVTCVKIRTWKIKSPLSS